MPLLADVTVLPPKGLNTQWYLDVNRWARQTPGLHGFMHAYALWLGLVLVVLCFVAMYVVTWWRRDIRGSALMALGGAGTLIALGLNQVVGHAAQELRPFVAFPHALTLVPRASDYAFPSDHAVISGALVAAVVIVAARRTGPRAERHAGPGEPRSGRRRLAAVPIVALAVLLALFLDFSRIYVGVHYPGDVVAGSLLGVVVVLVVVGILRPLAYRVVRLVASTPLAFLGRRP